MKEYICKIQIPEKLIAMLYKKNSYKLMRKS